MSMVELSHEDFRDNPNLGDGNFKTTIHPYSCTDRFFRDNPNLGDGNLDRI